MKLYPQNLRDRQHADIVRRRSYGVSGNDARTYGAYISSDPPPPRMGFLGRVWARGSGMTEEQAATGLPAASMSTLGTMWAVQGLVLPFSVLIPLILIKKGHAPAEATILSSAAIAAATSYLSTVIFPRLGFRSLHNKPLAMTEIEGLLEKTDDELGRAHLCLVRDAIRQEVPEAVEEDLRTAIKALAEAIDRLPAVMAMPLDTAALRREAETLLADAAREPDRVTAESVERRADALFRRADSNDRSALLSRRANALKQEIIAQTEALREGLAAFNTGTIGDISDLSHLAESARRVAAEATSAADARVELEEGQRPQAARARNGYGSPAAYTDDASAVLRSRQGGG